MKRLDDLDLKRISDAEITGEKYISKFEGKYTLPGTDQKVDKQTLRWCHFKRMSAEAMLSHVQMKVFPFLKQLNGYESPFTEHMKNAVFIIPKPSLLVGAMSTIEEIFDEIEKDANEGGQAFQDIQGDVYEMLLSEIATAGKNGQFRTPRHIIKLIAELVAAINQVHNKLSKQVNLAINISLTTRNWLIGYYIQEYEQHGEDRALYGKELIRKLSEKLQKLKISQVEIRELRRYRQFYQTYPQIWESLTPGLKNTLISAADEKRESVTPISGEQLISRLSFSHIVELLRIDDTIKRAFYEIECIHGNWSVRELKRQINSLYYERSDFKISA